MSENITRTSRGRILTAALACILLLAMLCMPVSATVGTTETTAQNDTADDIVPLPEVTTLARADIKALAEIVAAAQGDEYADDKRTPREKLTAAYLEGNLADAQSAVKTANEAAKKNALSGIDFATLNMQDIKSIIEEMKTTVELEKPTGFFAVIQLAAGSVLSWLTKIVGGNYVLGLLIFALILELCMLPLSIKQHKNTLQQASLRPKEMAIRKKYAGRDDNVTKQKITQETQELYQKEGFNPAGGCLPLLIQMPIILILYQVVINPLVYVMKFSTQVSEALMTFINTSASAGGLGESMVSNRGTIEIASFIREYGSEFFDKLENFLYFNNGAEIVESIQNASWPNFNLFGLNLGLVPTFPQPDWLWIIPILTFFVYFGSMKLTRKLSYQPAATDRATGCSNGIMDFMMPIFSTYICFIVPAALGVYWMIKSVFGTLIKLILTKAMPIPTFTEEDYKAAEREIIKGKPAASTASRDRAPSGKPVRSLHHIDDEDFEDTRAAALERKAREEAYEAEKAKEAEQKAEAQKANGLLKNEDDRPALSMRELREKVKEKKRLDAEQKKAAEAVKSEEKAEQEKTAETEDETDK